MKYITKILLVCTLIISYALSASATNMDYKIDPTHSSVWFRILHLGISAVYGAFSDISGKISFNPNTPEHSSIEAIVKTSSINTLNDKRDEHLRGTDFFNVEHYPEAIFKSTSWTKIDDNHFHIKGTLTLLGVEKPVEFDAHLLGIGKGRQNEDRIGFEAVFTIKRSDFGMTKYAPPQLGDEVILTVAIEAENK
ncbi:MAG TPA: YceI family protein [Candidatus Hydrogenedens sp.]|nr:YceI family protein [Candidatus Hydrogenedens sp.]HOL19076.1 YceI family protein [Candidatus Hydrogenedens sp.]HPP58106.1 YceI family protein [Candidatus Hydrogenedens sp.]